MDNLTVVIPFRNGYATLGRLLDSLPDDQLVVIADDQSTPALEVETDDPERENVTAIRLPERGYFAGAVNAGLEACATDVLVLNQDAWLEGDAWQDLVREWQQSGVAIAGGGVLNHPAWPKGYVQGQFMFLSRAAINKVGHLNARDYPLWGCTAEWQLRACRAGFRADPRMVIPGFRHAREGAYGESIQQALRDEPEKESLFIRTPPRISVVITCCNYGRYLTDAVNSLVGGKTSLGELPPQTFQSFEVVIVDFASTDETPQVGKALADPWKAIRYMRTDKWIGVAAAMNVGIKNSHGQYIAPLDADDLMEPERLGTLLHVAERYPHSVIYDDLTVVRNGKKIDRWDMPEYEFEQVLYKNPMHKGLLYPRRAWQEAGGYPEVMTKGREDWAFNIALGAKGWCGVHVSEPMYLYRREGQNRTLDNAGPEWRARFLEQLENLFPNLYAGERPMACCGSGPVKSQRLTASRPPGGRMAGALNALPGSEGMVQVQYLLNAAAPKPFFGAVSGTRYAFGGQRKIGWVDARDAPALLDILEGRRKAFRLYSPPAPAEVAPTAKVDSALRELGVDAQPRREWGDVLRDTASALQQASASDPARAGELADALLPKDIPGPAEASEQTEPPAEEPAPETPKRKRGKA